MKLLFDENLSRKLAWRLADLFADSVHVSSIELVTSPDRAIWDFARISDFVIVSTDADFYELALVEGPPPKVIWLRSWSHPTRDPEAVLRREAIRNAEFVRDEEAALLVLDR